MANEIRVKARSTITAQTNSSALDTDYDPTSASYTGGTPTVIDNTYDAGTENALGAHYLTLELNVTDAPATAGTAEVWYSTSEDGTNYTLPKYSHTVGNDIGTTDNVYYDAGLFELTSQFTKLYVHAQGYDIDACTLLATPKLVEAV